MKEYVKIIYPLVVISVVFGLALALTYQGLSQKLEDAKVNEERDALTSVMSNAAAFTVVTNGDAVYFEAKDSAGTLIGYVFKEGNVGYGGPVVTLIGVTLDGKVAGIRITDASQETPGLGYKCTEEPWQAQFTGLTVENTPRSKEDYAKYGLNAITGSTFTSMAVANNIYDALSLFGSIARATNGGATNE